MAFHALTVEETRTRLKVAPDDQGLSPSDVAARLSEHGPNTLPAPEPVTLGAIVLHQFLSPLIYILFAAAIVAVVLGDFVDAGFIVLIVSINAALGAYQEWRAERSAAALQDLLKVMVRIRRAGREDSIGAEELVPGDVVLLESGNRVPADLRLVRVTGLEVDESFLTGESVTVHKTIEPVAPEAPLGDRHNMAYAGATVLAGRAVGLVSATGRSTEVGAIAAQVTSGTVVKTPLVQRMERFSRQISVAVLVACAALIGLGLSTGMPIVEVFFLAVALAVSAIPEGLPVAVTVTLSIAATRMAKRNVIVRRLTAVEGLGSCTMIASDKTGTLTVNQQTARSIAIPSGPTLDVTGEGYNDDGEVRSPNGAVLAEGDRPLALGVAQAGVLCNEARLAVDDGEWTQQGDAVDVAFLALGLKLGIHTARVRADAKVLGELPFESSRAYAATFYEADGQRRVAVKGALETVLPRCTTMRTAAGDVPVDAAAIDAQSNALTSLGQRVIAVAEGALDASFALDGDATSDHLPPLTLLGVVGLLDPPRAEAAAAVAQCRAAGVEVAMVTGDHPRTAFAIARDLGIATDESRVVTGAALAAAGPGTPAFKALVAEGRVFARVAPLQKLDIVEALRAAGHFVAVTGDGVNDAPALKAAHIGVAMGSGSDVTKDAASLIVTDDNFASIEAGIEEGRFAYDNIRKVTYLLISTGLAEVLLVLASLVLGLPLPLFAVQLLWLNLVTNGIQEIGLAFEAGEPGAMRRPPRRPSEGIFDGLMIRQVTLIGVAMAALATGYWSLLLSMGVAEEHARSQLLLLFVLMQNVHVFNCRSERESAFRIPLARNWMLVGGVVAALGVHVAATYVPLMQRLLRVEPVAFGLWAAPMAVALLLLLLAELDKWVRRRRAGASALVR